jgi:hypothetical protein
MKYILHQSVGENRREKAIDTDLVKQAWDNALHGKGVIRLTVAKSAVWEFWKA